VSAFVRYGNPRQFKNTKERVFSKVGRFAESPRVPFSNEKVPSDCGVTILPSYRRATS